MATSRTPAARFPGAFRLRRLLLLALACALALPAPARAQASPADTAAILLDAAGRLSAEGRADAAAELLAFIRSHYATTPAGAEAARRLAAAPAPQREATGRAAALRSTSGRTELTVWGTTYGIFLGLAAPPALNAQSSGAYGLGLLLGAPAGFMISRAYANATAITEGEARAITFGGTWGTWQGYGWAKLAGLLERNVSCPAGSDCGASKETSGTAALRAMILGSLAGIGAGAAAGNTLHVTPGAATTVNFAALWGTGYGVAGAALFGVNSGNGALTMALIGGDAALLGAALTAPGWRLSRERARLISIAGLAGVLAGGGIDLILQVDNSRVAVGIPMAGGTIGMLLGAQATRGMPPETAAAGGGGSPGGALLRLEGGRVGLALPAVAPMLRKTGTGPGDVAPSLYVPLLHARF
jgi:hypothetical protein